MGVPNGRIYEGGGGPEWTDLRNNRGSRMDVENSIESHKPVEIGDLRPCGDPAPVGMVRVQPDAQKPLTGR